MQPLSRDDKRSLTGKKGKNLGGSVPSSPLEELRKSFKKPQEFFYSEISMTNNARGKADGPISGSSPLGEMGFGMTRERD